jgi:hypothetical protein
MHLCASAYCGVLRRMLRSMWPPGTGRSCGRTWMAGAAWRLLRPDGHQSCVPGLCDLGGSSHRQSAVHRGDPTADDGGARVRPLQRAAAAGRGGGRVAQRPRQATDRGSQLTPPSSTLRCLECTGSPGTLGGSCYTAVCIAGLRQCTGVLLARLVSASFRRRCAAQSRHVWLLWPCLMERVCRIWLTSRMSAYTCRCQAGS